MGFWQNLVESYDKNAEALRLQYPLSTTTISNNGDVIVLITVDENGRLNNVGIIDKAKKNNAGTDIVRICIPVTEKSSSRSGTTIAPHPVFDQYEYLCGNGNKFDAYLSQLKMFSEWEKAPVQVKAIYKYVNKRTIADDLKTLSPTGKTNIVFEVEIPEFPQLKVWEDKPFYGQDKHKSWRPASYY